MYIHYITLQFAILQCYSIIFQDVKLFQLIFIYYALYIKSCVAHVSEICNQIIPHLYQKVLLQWSQTFAPVLFRPVLTKVHSWETYERRSSTKAVPAIRKRSQRIQAKTCGPDTGILPSVFFSSLFPRYVETFEIVGALCLLREATQHRG